MRKLILLAAFAANLFAAPTRIVDTVKYANNTNASGTVRIEWPAFTIGATSVAAGFVQSNIVNGVLDVSLQPTDAASPSGTVYTVRFFLTSAPASTEYWSVPTSATAVTLATVRMLPQSALDSLSIAPGQITQGGATTGQCIMWNGTAWAPGTCAAAAPVSSVHGRTGAVVAASGDYTGAQVANTPSGGIAATDVQAALNELDSEKAASSHAHVIGDTTGLQTALDGKLAIASNLSDVASPSAARTSLGLGGAAVLNVGTTAGTVAAGDHTHVLLTPYEATFTSQTSVTVANATHGRGSAVVSVNCFDTASPRNAFEPDTWTVDPSTFQVAITFAVAASGRCLIR